MQVGLSRRPTWHAMVIGWKQPPKWLPSSVCASPAWGHSGHGVWWHRLGCGGGPGAAVGATTSSAIGFIYDNLSFKNVLRGALSGALTAGLLNGIATALGSLNFVGEVAAGTGVQRFVQATLGRSVKDSAMARFACGFLRQVAGQMLNGLQQAVDTSAMTAMGRRG